MALTHFSVGVNYRKYACKNKYTQKYANKDFEVKIRYILASCV